MNTYIIGDLQGCFNSFQALLEKIRFNHETDRLGFVGDLVNRGPQSLETLRFVSKLNNPIVVLGNHDLHLLALYFQQTSDKSAHTLDAILQAPDADHLISWLLQQSFLFKDNHDRFVITHAGIPPQWSLSTAEKLAKEVHEKLKQNPALFLKHMYGDQPAQWNDHLTDWDRTRYIVNAFTRMRFCDKTGKLDLHNKTTQSENPDIKPWFDWPRQDQVPIYFGHWASLEGKCDAPNIIALDTGCLWGGKLTAIRVEDNKLFSVEKSPSDETGAVK